MKHKKKIIIGIGILLVGILFWQFGLFYRYNYLTAKVDILREKPDVIECVLKYGRGSRTIKKKLDEKYGYNSVNIGCFRDGIEKKGIEMYNAEIEKYLIKRNGADWKVKYQIEKDSLLKIRAIPRTAFWIEKNGKGNWYYVNSKHSHENNAIIAIYDKSGELLTKGNFTKICPIDGIKFIDDLKTEIDFYDGENIQLKDNCYLLKNK